MDGCGRLRVHHGDELTSILLVRVLHLGDIAPNYTYLPTATDSFSTSKDVVEARGSVRIQGG